jgi:cobalt-zinc-cadmium efflux system outer membrane protein
MGLASPEPVAPLPLPTPSREITIDEALAIALVQNPDLAVNRGDVGIAEAQRVIANTYPFNPTFEAQIQAADNANLAQHIRQSYTILQEFERGGKAGFRSGAANAGVQKSQWQQRASELAVAAEVYRRFEGVLFARGKLDLARQTSRLNSELAENAHALLQAGKVTGSDLVIAEQEALDSRQAEAIAEAELRTAHLELRSAVGMAEDVQLEPRGDLQLPRQLEIGVAGLVQAALSTQPDVFAKLAAFQQADAAVGLAIANQKADVTFGPAMEVDENKTFFIGGTLQVPLQIYNKKEGEVLQAEAERAKAAAELEQSRLKVKMAVLAAWQQYDDARRLAATLAEQVLPTSDRYLQDAEKLLSAGQIDLLKLVELRRRRLAAQQQLLDAQNQMVLRQIELETLSGNLLAPYLLPHDRSQSQSPQPLPPPPLPAPRMP